MTEQHRSSNSAATSGAQDTPWWADAVVYQLYVRSFADSNGDGIGDLGGIRSRLGYLEQLGVDALWLNPCYPSPQHDHGYDVSDYFNIEPDYGDLAEFDRLVAEAGARGIKVLMDVVPNHCSSEHPWFVEAVAAGRGSAARERFWFREGKGEGGSEPPNNWQSIFGGSSWSRINEPDGSPGQWYLHIFDSRQPDLNWNHPEVAEMFDSMLRFWFDRGVAGFRADAIAVLGKADGLPDYDRSHDKGEIGNENPHHTFHPSGHVAWRRWRKMVEDYAAEHPDNQPFLVCEAYTPDVATFRAFVNPEQFHQGFVFDLMMRPWTAAEVTASIAETVGDLLPAGLAPAWTLNNHDAQRAVTRRGRADAHLVSTGNNLLNSTAPVDIALGIRRARALTLVQLALPGSVYLYCGEELGLPEVLDIPAEARQDPVFLRTEGRELGRDGCRVPLPWNADPTGSFGFSPAGAAAPWMPQPADWGTYAADAQGVEGSTLEFYRAAIAERRRHHAFRGADFQWRSSGSTDVLAFSRGDALVVLNTSATAVALPAELVGDRRVAAASQPDQTSATTLAGDTAMWLVAR